MFSQTPSRRQTSYGQQSTPGRFPLTSGVSRMNTITNQSQTAFESPMRPSQVSAQPSPSYQKKPVVVEETYIRKLTYDDAEHYEECHAPFEDSDRTLGETFEQQSAQAAASESDEHPRPLFEKEAQQPQRAIQLPKLTPSLQRQPQQHEHVAPKERKVQFQEQQQQQQAPTKTEHPNKPSRDEVEKRLIATQRRRRELMAELQRLDAEQMELITQLQTLPK
jgi:hypothetical protein